MKTRIVVTAVALMLGTGGAFAQSSEHQHEHQAPAQTQPQSQDQTKDQTKDQSQVGDNAVPDQCRAAMQSMPRGCMEMMQRMGGMMGAGAGGGMMGGGMMSGGAAGRMMGGGGTGGGMMGGGASPSAADAGASTSTRAYLAAVEKMHGPMTEGVKASDPDVAFVRGMIAHHEAGIDMARVGLAYGNEPLTKGGAGQTIREQQHQIDEMQAWLVKRQK
mgnify:CR=1 FL=1